MMQTTEIVNLIRLTKLENHALEAIAQHDKGCNTLQIAKDVWGAPVLGREKRRGHNCYNMPLCYAAKSSLSRTLKQLWLKGLVVKCKPIHYYGWVKVTFKTGEKGAYWGKARNFLRGMWFMDGQVYSNEIEIDKFDLPENCRVWYFITQKGKESMRRT
jgi:hypothetical protein